MTNFDQIYEGAIEPGKEPRKLFKHAYEGAITATSYAEILLSKAIKKYGPNQKVEYPDTAYFLPVIRSLSGEEVKTLKDLQPILNRMRGKLKSNLNLENVLLAGEATLYAAEIIEALRYVKNPNPHVEPWTGFLGDPVLRKYGIKMVDWTIPGVAVILGR